MSVSIFADMPCTGTPLPILHHPCGMREVIHHPQQRRHSCPQCDLIRFEIARKRS